MTLPIDYYYNYSYKKRPILDRFPVTLADGTTRDMIQLFFCDTIDSGTYAWTWKEWPGYHDNYIIEGIGCINSLYPLILYTCVSQAFRRIYWEQKQYCSRLNMFRQYGKIVYLAPEHVTGMPHDEKYYTFHKMPFYPDIDVTMVASITEEEKGARTEGKSTGIYNIMGQKLSDVRKGINIVDGKKNTCQVILISCNLSQ